MRPLLLELEGFGAFSRPTTVDFTDTDFFALVGPTGAGKSTVIDGICFALYGSIPRLEDKRVTDVLSLGSAEMRVRLTFDVAGITYVAARVVRKNPRGGVNTAEARLERVDSGLVLAGRESEFKAAIEQLLGLTFDDFTRCVVLPQGAFARFLHDKPKERRELLVRLMELGIYSRIMKAANARESELSADIRELDGAIGELRAVDEADITASVARLSALVEFAQHATAVARELTDDQSSIAQHDARLADNAEFASHLAKVRVPQWIADQSGEMQRMRVVVDGAAEGISQSAVALGEAQRALEEVGDIAALRSALQGWEQIDTLNKQLIERRTAATVADQLAQSRRQEVDSAEAAVVAACAAVEILRHQHRAYHLAVELVPGEACPVCEQPVDHLPFPAAPADAGEAQRAEQLARQRRDGAVAAHAASDRNAHTAADRVSVIDQQLAALLDDFGALDRAAIRAQLERAVSLEQHVRALREADSRLRIAEKQARDELAEAKEREQRVLDEYSAQRDPLVSRGAPERRIDDLIGSWIELADWAKLAGEQVAVENDRDREALNLVRNAADHRLQELRARCSSLRVEVSPRADADAIRLSAQRSITVTEGDLEQMRHQRNRRQELSERRAQIEVDRRVAHDLGLHLKTDRFQAWLVEETLRTLAERAAGTLRKLSSGQFSMRLNSGEFEIIDHTAADETRSVRTLSGGETFQASLALALALSDHLVELSGRTAGALDAIFLDEGFGTLDSESLDTVASTIEALGTDGRMVGIVTHVKELADRVPVRYVVSKDARTAHVVREVAT